MAFDNVETLHFRAVFLKPKEQYFCSFLANIVGHMLTTDLKKFIIFQADWNDIFPSFFPPAHKLIVKPIPEFSKQ